MAGWHGSKQKEQESEQWHLSYKQEAENWKWGKAINFQSQSQWCTSSSQAPHLKSSGTFPRDNNPGLNIWAHRNITHSNHHADYVYSVFQGLGDYVSCVSRGYYQKTSNKKCLQGLEGNAYLYSTSENVIGTVVMKNTIYCPQKLKSRTTTRFSNRASGHIFEEAKVNSLKKCL